jgi:prephenate dehydratase
MAVQIAHLGPPGTYTEAAAIAYTHWLTQLGQDSLLCPYSSIVQTLHAVTQQQADFAVVPVENSVQGSVTLTLDTLWELDTLQIQQALILPITHTLLSHSPTLETLQTVYSHPQALAQCQRWLERYLPHAQLIPANSTTEALQYLKDDERSGAIASERASQLYHIPILAQAINDYPDNCTRFWVLGRQPATNGDYISLGFSTPANVPGALVKPLSIFAQRNINLSRIESRPTKRFLGEYLFYIDLEANSEDAAVQSALQELSTHTEVLKIFGNYSVLPIHFPEA